MSVVRSSLALARSYLIENSRSRAAIFWTLAFPQLFLFVFGFIFAEGKPEKVAYMMPGLLTLTTITSAFFGYSMRLVAERERGALRRLRVTPTPAGAVVAGHMVHAMANLSAALLFQLGLALAIFRFPIHGSLGNLALMLFAGELAFVPLGLFVGCIGRDTRSAPALTNLIVFPQMFLSGAAMPFFLLPAWVQQLGRLLPATYLNEGLQRAMIAGLPTAALAGPIAVLLLFGVIGLVLNSMLFRWESSDPLPGGRLAAGLMLLALALGAVAIWGPALSMAVAPGR
ncbi:MAG: ABC transporter permease [Thermoanaerobaculia bacterium]